MSGRQPRSPAVLQRWAAFRLRELRIAAGYTQPQVASALGRTVSSISHLESRIRLPRIEWVEPMLRLYGAEDEVEEFRERLRLARVKHWWAGEEGTRWPTGFDVYLGLEQGARSLDWWEPSLVPGIIQAPGYARSVIAPDETSGVSAETVEFQLTLRERRREAVTRTEDPLRLWVVVDEAALRRRVEPEVMREQLDLLLDLSRLGTVDFQVIPDGRVSTLGSRGPFTVMGFDAPGDPGTVYIETEVRAVWIEDPHDVDTYRTLMNRLRASAETPAASAALVESMRKELA